MSEFVGDENVVPQQNKQKSAGGGKASKGKTIEETYTKKTQLEHILLRPDTYIGSVEKQIQLMWVFDAETRQLVNRNCAHVPGLYKIFDEIIVNAADNKQRDPTMTRIEVTINPDNNSIRVWNNGNGIPIVIHQEEKIYIPELVIK
jgi:DNA topoisomerase-2